MNKIAQFHKVSFEQFKESWDDSFPGASEEEIKKAFKTMARKYHPDLHPGDKEAEAKFKEVNEAYEVLSDKDKKARYDQFGFAGVDPNFGGGAGGGNPYAGGAGGFA